MTEEFKKAKQLAIEQILPKGTFGTYDAYECELVEAGADWAYNFCEKEYFHPKLAIAIEALEFAIDGHKATGTLFTERDHGSMVKHNVNLQRSYLEQALKKIRGEHD